MRGAWSGVALSVALGVSGCGSDELSESGGSAREVVMRDAQVAKDGDLEVQYEILQDGVVSANEYEDAVMLTIECFKDAGLDAGGPWLNPLDNVSLLYDVEIPVHQTPMNASGQRCDSAYLSLVQPNVLDSHEQVTAPVLRDAILSCIADAGGPSSTDDGPLPKNMKEITEFSGDEHFVAVQQCVSSETRRLYPEIPIVFYGY